MASIGGFIAWVKRYWKPVVGVIAAAVGVGIYYVVIRGIRSIVGGNGTSPSIPHQQQHDNDEAVDSARKQQSDNAEAIDKLKRAIDILKRARDRSNP